VTVRCGESEAGQVRRWRECTGQLVGNSSDLGIESIGTRKKYIVLKYKQWLQFQTAAEKYYQRQFSTKITVDILNNYQHQYWLPTVVGIIFIINYSQVEPLPIV
jgi:hypothetical protein